MIMRILRSSQISPERSSSINDRVNFSRRVAAHGRRLLRADRVLGNAVRQREPRLLDPKFLAFVRQQPCCICGATSGIEAAHIRMGNPDLGKMPAGMQQKPDDRWSTPLCGASLTTNRPGCHARQHEVREIDFWMFHGKDPFDIAARIYAEYGGVSGKPRLKRKTVKPRKPKHLRQKIQNRGFQRKGST